MIKIEMLIIAKLIIGTNKVIKHLIVYLYFINQAKHLKYDFNCMDIKF